MTLYAGARFIQPAGIAEGFLLASIASCEVPGELRYLSIDNYKEIRDSYSDIREAFKRLTGEIALTSRLNRTEDSSTFQSRLENSVKDFIEEFDEYRTTRYARKIAKWTPMSTGTLLGIVGSLAGPVPAVIGKFAQFTMQVVDKKVKRESQDPVRDRAHQMLCNLQEDVLRKSHCWRMNKYYGMMKSSLSVHPFSENSLWWRGKIVRQLIIPSQNSLDD